MSTLWEITNAGKTYLEKLTQRLETSNIPGMYGYVVTDTQERYRLEVLSTLNTRGVTPEAEFPGSASADYIEEKWPLRAKIQRTAQRKAIDWLRDHQYIATIGQG